jgi:hypothetical protein
LQCDLSTEVLYTAGDDGDFSLERHDDWRSVCWTVLFVDCD